MRWLHMLRACESDDIVKADVLAELRLAHRHQRGTAQPRRRLQQRAQWLPRSVLQQLPLLALWHRVHLERARAAHDRERDQARAIILALAGPAHVDELGAQQPLLGRLGGAAARARARRGAVLIAVL